MRYLAAIVSLAAALSAQGPTGIPGKSGLPSIPSTTFTDAIGGAFCCSFYVSQSTGLDSNPGTLAQPWQTIAKVNAATLTAGQTVGFKSGDTWRETLTPGQSGTAGSPITYTSYGSGGQPIIDAADLKTWTQGTGNPAQDCANGTTPTFCSGMETGGSTFTDWGSRTQTSANITQSTAQVAHGSFSAALTGTGGNNQAYIQTTAFTAWANNSTHYARLYMYLPSGTFNAGGTQLKFLAPATGGFVTLDWNGTAVASVSLVGGAGGVFVGTLNTSAFTLNTWHYVDVMWVVSATVGGMQVWIDGTSIGSVLNKDTHLDTGATFWRVGMTGTAPTLINSGQSVYFDDARFSDNGPIGAFNSGGAYPTTVWRASQTSDPLFPNFSGVIGIPESSLGAVSGPNEYYWDGSTFIYAYGPGDPTSTVEIPVRTNAITISGKSYLAFSGLDIRGARADGLHSSGASGNMALSGNTVELNWNIGAAHLENTATANNWTITGNIFRYNGASGQNVNSAHWANWTVTNNQAYSNAQIATTADGDHQFSAGLHTFCNTNTAGAGSVYSGNLSYSNGTATSVGGQGRGIHIDTCTGVTVTGNIVHDNTGDGIFLEKNVNGIMTYNVAYNNASIAFESNFTLKTSGEASWKNATGNLVANNSSYGGYWGIFAGAYEASGTALFQNNIIQNNLATAATSGTNIWVDIGGNNDGTYGTGNVYTFNGAGSQATNFLYFCVTSGSACSGGFQSTYAGFQTAYGSTTNNLTQDPLFVSPPSNLNLQSGSPAIGAGVFIAGVSTANPPNIGAK